MVHVDGLLSVSITFELREILQPYWLPHTNREAVEREIEMMRHY